MKPQDLRDLIGKMTPGRHLRIGGDAVEWASRACRKQARPTTSEDVAMNDADRERILARFLSKVNKTDTCWLWTAALDKHGYGAFKMAAHRSNAWFRAHRAAWLLFCGKLDPGLSVCHSCDTPRCVRPDHLFIGTHADNMADMVAKGRGSNRNKNAPPTSCRHGHSFTPENTYIWRTSRNCRTCLRRRKVGYRRHSALLAAAKRVGG